MNDTYPPNSLGARLWGGNPAKLEPIAIPQEIARAASGGALDERDHTRAAAVAAALVAVIALLAYAALAL